MQRSVEQARTPPSVPPRTPLLLSKSSVIHPSSSLPSQLVLPIKNSRHSSPYAQPTSSRPARIDRGSQPSSRSHSTQPLGVEGILRTIRERSCLRAAAAISTLTLTLLHLASPRIPIHRAAKPLRS